MRTEECDNACYLPFWVTNPLITKCKVATRNPGPILPRCKSHGLCLPNHDCYSRRFTGGSKSGQDSVLGPKILRISPQKGWFEYLWAPAPGGRTEWCQAGTRVGESEDGFVRSADLNSIYRKKALLLGVIIIAECTATLLHNCSSLR